MSGPSDLARDILDAIEPMMLRVRRELGERQEKFQESLQGLITALVRAEVAELMARHVQMSTVHSWVAGMTYWASTLVAHRGGLWQALNNTGQEPGEGADWRLLANGLADISGYIDEADPRLLTIANRMSSGDTINLELRLPLPFHLGKYEAGRDYEQGDEVAWLGSTWRAQRATKTEPPSQDWLLVAKAGERGKRGDGR